MADRMSKVKFSTISQRAKTMLNMAVCKPCADDNDCSILDIEHSLDNISSCDISKQSQPKIKVTDISSIYSRPYSLTTSRFSKLNETKTTLDLENNTIFDVIINKMNKDTSTSKKEIKNQDQVNNSSNIQINKSLLIDNTVIDLTCYEKMPPKEFSIRNRHKNKSYTEMDITSPKNNQFDFDSDDSTRDKDYYPSDGSESQDEVLDLRPKNKSKLSRKKKFVNTSNNSVTVLKTKNIIVLTKDVPEFQENKPTRRHSIGNIQREITISASRKRRNTIDITAVQTPIISNSSETLCSDPELLLSQPSRKRKKYNTSVALRKLESVNAKKLEHSVKTGCTEKCLKKCSTQINQEDRIAINKRYWEMSWTEQHTFVEENTAVAIPKRKITSELKRRPRRVFTLKKIDGTRVEVCKIQFLTTLGYKETNDRILHYDIKDTSIDGRGKHQKTPKSNRDLLTQHIQSFNPTQHHYRREHAPLRQYLPSDVNIIGMHQNYCEKYPENTVSYEIYRKHLKTMNISFTQLGHEECEMCEKHELHQKQTDTHHIAVDCSICVNWKKHHNKFETARKLYKTHKELPRTQTDIYFSADLEKVIMLPRMETFKSIIFAKRLIAFNQTFAPVGKITNECKPLTVIWNDSIAGRKQEDIISAFFQFLLRNRDVANINLWVDNCTAQNKNWLLYSLLVYMLNSDMICVETLTLYYFEPGHTFMSCDQVHRQVELAMKKKGKLYDFTDFEEAVGSINQNRVNVKSMTATDFINLENQVSVKRIQSSNPRAYLKDMCQVSFTRKSYNLQYKNDFTDEFISLCFMNDKFLKDPSCIKLEHRSTPNGVDHERKADILGKISSIVPVHKQLFWKELPIKINDTASTSGASSKTSRLNKNKNSRLSE